MLKEIKTGDWHYFEDSLGRIQGEYKAWHDNGVMYRHCYYVDGQRRGEYKSWYDNGVLYCHGYYVDSKQHGEYKLWDKDGVLRGHRYYVNHVRVHDFLLNPLTDEEKMLLVLKHGGLLLPRGDLC